MKKIEKDLILKDLDYINNEYEIKTQKINSIMSLFMDEEPEITKKAVDESVKKAEEAAEKAQEEDNKKQTENPLEEPTEEPIIEETENDNITVDLPPDIKSLYRKIVMMTHPDKNKNIRNLELYSDFYRRVIKAKDENDKAEIIYIAYKLKLPEVYDVEDEHFGSVRKKIKEKEMSSTNLNYNSFWIWYHTDNQQLKRLMVEQINMMLKRR
jgi:hypothetical protein